MGQQRYPGERKGLLSFLADLLPVLERELGPADLLVHCVRRALGSADLDQLRRARQMFDNRQAMLRRAAGPALTDRHGAGSTGRRALLRT